MQFGDDDVLEDIYPSAGHKKFRCEQAGLFFFFGELYEVVEGSFECEKGDIKLAGGGCIAVADDLA